MQRILLGDMQRATTYLREAEQLLAQCKRMFCGTKQTKVMPDGTIIQVASVAGVDKVLIKAPFVGAMEIVIASSVELLGYSYTANKLYSPSQYATDARVFSAFVQHVLTDGGLSIYRGVKSLPREAGTDLQPFGYFPRYGCTLGLAGTTLMLIADEATTLGTLEAKTFDELVPQGAFAMARYNEVNTWNKLDVPYVWQVPPRNVSSSIERWHWQPRIWYPDKENLYYAAGMWYGAVGYRTYGPAEEIHVQFGCLLADHYGEHVGYCEVFRKAVGLREPGSGLPPEDKDYLEAWFSLDLSDVGRGSFVDASSSGVRFIHNSTWLEHKAPAFSVDYISYFGALPEGVDLGLAFWSGPPKELSADELESGATPSTGSYGTIAFATRQYVIHAHREYGAAISSSLVICGSGYVAHAVSSSGQHVAVLTDTGVFVYDITTSMLVSEKELSSGYESLAFVPTAHPDSYALPADGTGHVTDLSTVKMSPAAGGVTMYWEPANQGTGTSGWKVTCEDGKNAVGFTWAGECWEWEMIRIRPTDSHNLDRDHTVTVEGVSYSSGSFFGLAEVLPYYLGMFAGAGALVQEIVLATWDEAGKPLAVAASQGLNTTVSTIRRAGITVEYGFGVSSGGPDYYTPSDNAVGPYAWSASGGSLTAVDGGPVAADTTKVLFVPPEIVCNDSFASVNVTDSCGREASRVVQLTGPPTLTIEQGGVGDNDVIVRGGVPPYSIGLSCGSYDQETGEADVEGCCGTGTATVVDSCGANAECPYIYPSGAWVTVDLQCPGDSTCYDNNAYCDIYQCYSTIEYTSAYTRIVYTAWPGYAPFPGPPCSGTCTVSHQVWSCA